MLYNRFIIRLLMFRNRVQYNILLYVTYAARVDCLNNIGGYG